MDDHTTVYLAYDAAGALLYVGIGKNWARRLAQHSERSLWYGAVTRVDLRPSPTRAAAEEDETRLIRTLRPRFNIRKADERAWGVVCEECGREPAYSLSYFQVSRPPTDPADFKVYAWGEFLSIPDDEIARLDAEGRAAWRGRGRWAATGDCTADREHYYVLFSDRGHGFFDSRDEFSGWLEHLRGKVWFEDAPFVDAIRRVLGFVP